MKILTLFLLLFVVGCAMPNKPVVTVSNSPSAMLVKLRAAVMSQSEITTQSVLPPPPPPSFSLQYGLQWPTMADPNNQSVVVVIVVGDANTPLSQWTIYGSTNAQTFSFPISISQPSQQFMLYTSNTVSHGVSAWATK